MVVRERKRDRVEGRIEKEEIQEENEIDMRERKCIYKKKKIIKKENPKRMKKIVKKQNISVNQQTEKCEQIDKYKKGKRIINVTYLVWQNIEETATVVQQVQLCYMQF